MHLAIFFTGSAPIQTGVIILPTQNKALLQGKSLKISIHWHCLIPPTGVPFNDTCQNQRTLQLPCDFEDSGVLNSSSFRNGTCHIIPIATRSSLNLQAQVRERGKKMQSFLPSGSFPQTPTKRQGLRYMSPTVNSTKTGGLPFGDPKGDVSKPSTWRWTRLVKIANKKI